MSTIALDKLKQLRRILGKTQREMAELLGISIRAVQSYEQGWRAMPPALQKLVSFLLYQHWRKDNPSPRPCWEINRCPTERQCRCASRQFCNGECCWITTGNRHRGEEMKGWEEKFAKCRTCPVLTCWLPAKG